MGIHNLAQIINKGGEAVIQPETPVVEPEADDGDTIIRGED